MGFHALEGDSSTTKKKQIWGKGFDMTATGTPEFSWDNDI